MAINPATAKAIATVAKKVLTDEETRKKLVLALIIGVTVIIIILAIPIYLLTHPTEAIKVVLGSENVDISTIESFKFQNDMAIIKFGTNVKWNDGAAYPMPLNGNIILNYDEETHRGIDIVGDWHAEVTAITDGSVEKITFDNNYGDTVLIKHFDSNGNIFYSFYAYLSIVNVIEGQSIYQNMVLGYEGGEPGEDKNTGISASHHLHFEIRTGEGQEVCVDPSLYILGSSSENTTSSESER